MCKVVHCKKEKYEVYIGRGSKWGNPYTHIKDRPTAGIYVCGTREEAISEYKHYILNNSKLMAALPELKGKILGCWCKPQSCHGDVLLELINEFYPDPS